jgi:PAS domain S-box-containing protein
VVAFDPAAVIEAIADAVLVFDYQGTITACNGAALRVLGHDRDTLIGQSFESLLSIAIRQALEPNPFDRFCDRAMRVAPTPVRLSLKRLGTSDVELAFAVTLAPLTDQADSGVVMTLRATFDTASLSGPTAFSSTPILAPSEGDPSAVYELAFDHAPIGLFSYNSDGVLTACNAAFEGIIGAPRNNILGLLLHTLPNEGVREAIVKSLRGERGRFEGEYLSALGARKSMVRAEFVPIRANNGTLRGGVGIVEDVTERRKLQARLAQADRLASVGTLAAGVAHEINNPLASVLSHLDFAQKRLHSQPDARTVIPEFDRVDEALTNALDGAGRVQRIVRDLKSFSRGGDDTLSQVAVEKALTAAITMATPILRGKAVVRSDLRLVHHVWADEARLAQVFLNLLLNAGAAMRHPESSDNFIDLRVFRQPDGRICAEITDNGSGIAPENLPHIFEPFFTTRPTGIGTGLGLSVCHGIIASLGGEITVESTMGRGSTFRVHLRAAPTSNTPQVLAHVRSPTHELRRLRVLVVDDETLLARSIELQLIGIHEVVVTTSGSEALSLIKSGATFTTVLCDVMLPDMSGMDLFEVIKQKHPTFNAHFVFMTGGSFSPRLFKFLQTHAVPCLEKPFSVEQLHEALEQPRPSSH